MSIKKAPVASGGSVGVAEAKKRYEEDSTMTAIETSPKAEAKQLIVAIMKNCVDGQLRQDIGYLSKILADIRKLAAIIEEADDE